MVPPSTTVHSTSAGGGRAGTQGSARNGISRTTTKARSAVPRSHVRCPSPAYCRLLTTRTYVGDPFHLQAHDAAIHQQHIAHAGIVHKLVIVDCRGRAASRAGRWGGGCRASRKEAARLEARNGRREVQGACHAGPCKATAASGCLPMQSRATPPPMRLSVPSAPSTMVKVTLSPADSCSGAARSPLRTSAAAGAHQARR